MTDENEPYSSIDSLMHAIVWPVVILVVVIGIAAIVYLILGVL